MRARRCLGLYAKVNNSKILRTAENSCAYNRIGPRDWIGLCIEAADDKEIVIQATAFYTELAKERYIFLFE